MNRITDYSKLKTNITDWMADYIKSSSMSCFSLVLDKAGSSLFESIFLASQRSSLGGVIFSKSSSNIALNP